MQTASLLIGLLLGGIVGAGVMAFAYRKSRTEAESIAEAVSAKTIAKQTEQILQLAETKLTGKKELIDGSLKSVKDDLDRVERLMRSIGDGNVKIDTRLGDAAKVIKELSDTTGSLKSALTSNSNRGQWGERMAEDVLRLSGLIEGINYTKQKKIASIGSKPDFTFMLPQKLTLNMDVKFPFNNYQLYADAKTDEEREKYKKAFLKDVRNRVKEIQTRDYINPEEHTVDYVLLFIPNEQIFSFINEIDRSLVDEAMKSKTILCSPLSLYAILAVIRQSIDNFSIESKSQEMLTVLGGFKQQWEKFKEQMETVQDRFDLVHKGYEELTGTRERQLDRQLTKLEELRLDRGSAVPQIQETFEHVAAKNTMKVRA
jgi:DNA recombination protein RmuC